MWHVTAELSDRSRAGRAVPSFLAAAMLLLAIPATPAHALVMDQDGFEPDDTAAQAKQITLGATQQRTLHYAPPNGDVDWVYFDAVAGKRYIIQTHDLTPADTDTVLELYAADGTTLLADNDDFGFSFASLVTWKAAESGTLYIKVRPRHGGISGHYSLSLKEGGSITGRATHQGTTTPLGGITVDLWQWQQDGFYAFFETTTGSDGYYEFDVVPVGNWRVGFYDWGGRFAERFYDNKSGVDTANDVSVTAGTNNSNVNATMARLATTFQSVAGQTRVETAIAASQAAFSAESSSVILTTARNWPDALGGAALAGVLDCPILLTSPTALPGSVADEIARLGAKEVVILGGTAAVSADVEDVVGLLPGVEDVVRIKGANRYETAEEIAREVAERAGPGFDGTCFVATGRNFPDALAASPLAAYGAIPILLCDGAALRTSTLGVMDEIGVDSAVILGGTGAVSTAVETTLEQELGGQNVDRLHGSGRYETAVEVAEYGVDTLGLTWNRAALTTGRAFPDALAGGAMQARAGSVMLLTPPTSLDPHVSALLTRERLWIGRFRYLGGDSALSKAVRDQVKSTLY